MSARDEGDGVGYGRPPKDTRFKEGISGNPPGRPPGRRREIPYDAVLGQMVTIREDGHERRVTAAEAFLLHLTRKSLQGDSAAAGDLLAAVEAALERRGPVGEALKITIAWVGSGVGPTAETLGLAVKLNRFDAQRVRYRLKPWVVQAALARFGSRRLNEAEQREVWGATQTPHKVRWPDWWTERRRPEGPEVARRWP